MSLGLMAGIQLRFDENGQLGKSREDIWGQRFIFASYFSHQALWLPSY